MEWGLSKFKMKTKRKGTYNPYLLSMCDVSIVGFLQVIVWIFLVNHLSRVSYFGVQMASNGKQNRVMWVFKNKIWCENQKVIIWAHNITQCHAPHMCMY